MNMSTLRHFLRTRGHRFALGMMSLIILFWFYPEIQYASIFYNDGTSHIALIREMDKVWAHGGNITDFWMAYLNFGHALLSVFLSSDRLVTAQDTAGRTSAGDVLQCLRDSHGHGIALGLL
jgi:hypothetical protein